ncbi:DUF6259 domain-containing protein [Leifsonia sp. SIMBA_070]|uniref:DUF6259 domain-containing protein n=1 Tax=Leifsonia sp. SIMBA_070 TaxID=3085810 RepID=UPI00397E8005
MTNTRTIVLDDGRTRATFDGATGALTGLVNERGWNVVARPELGSAFRLLVPLDGRRNNVVEGTAQRPPSVEHTETTVAFTWRSVVSEHGGAHDIGVRQAYELTDGRLVVRTTIDNRSPLVVENVYAPVLGDLRPPTVDGTLTAYRHDYGSGMAQPMWPQFQNSAGYHGVDVPTQLAQQWMAGYGTPVVPYTLLQSDGQGLYVGVEEPTVEFVAWHAELWPGYADSLEASVPLTDELAGVPVRTRFAAVHIPYLLAGQSRTLVPLALEFYEGDWHAGADVYSRWRETWFAPAAVPAWAQEPHTWQQLQLNSPEDELRLSFSELVEVGREAAAAGVSAIQLVGFNEGGQDRGNPSHWPDSRLGGFDELRQAIADIQALGVRVVLFAKFNWADRSRDDFTTTWLQHAVKDPYGDYYLYPGYRYETATQLLDINTRRLVTMCFLSEAYLEECLRQFDVLVALGADGILYDECLHHLPSWCCFDESHGHRYGAPTYANDLELVRRFRERLGDRPDFLFAGEAVYDREFEAYGLSYHRSENRHHLPLHRYTAPAQQMMTAVTGFDDRNMVNQALLYRYIVSLEPYNFTGRLTDFPATVAYNRRMHELRVAARKWVWDGRFSDTIGATVTDEAGSIAHPYTVFSAADGSLAVCVANYGTAPVTWTVRMDGAPDSYRVRAVDDDEWSDTDGRVTLPPRSAAVIVRA